MQDWAKKSWAVLTGVLVSGLLLLPLYAQALGFGNIKVKSALNEPLDAEIELLSATDDDVKDLDVKLASREAFLRAGVDRTNQLTQLKFTVSKRSGKYYVIAKTAQSVREPFLNFLLEMNWKNGRMLREYTVLLDPPDRKSTQVAAAEPSLPTVAAQPAEPAPAPAPSEPAATPFVAPATETAKATEPATTAPTEAATPAPTEATPAAAPAPETAAAPTEEPAKPAGKKSKKKKKKGAAAKAEDTTASKPQDTPLPSAEPATAPEAPTPAAAPTTDVATAAPTPEATKGETLSPSVPLDENNNTDAKALEEAIKQSEAAHKAGGEAAPAGEVLSSAEKPASPAEPAATPSAETPAPAAEAAGTPAPEAAPSTTAEAPKSTETAPAPGSLDYGITKKGDNLWTIANKVKASDDVTIYQVMMALQQSNPNAFVKGNIHRLKANQVMRIEDPQLLKAMTKKQAAARYQEQTREWQDYLASVGAQVPRQGIVAGDTGTKPEETSGVPAGELTLTPPSGEGAGSGGSDKLAKNQNTKQLRKEIQKAVAEAESERRKNTELASRVEDLEKELKRLENLVTVKDSDLAALQRKLDDVQKARAASKASAQSEPVAAAPVIPEPPKPEIKPEPVAAPTPPPAEPAKPAVEAATTPAPAAAVTPPPAPQDTTPKSPTDVAAAKPETPANPPSAVQPVKPSNSGGIMGMLTGILGGMGLYLAAGGAVLLILLLAFVFIRRRNKVHFQESILKGGAGADSKLNSVMSAADAPTSQTSTQSSLMTGGESSFLSDFAISGVSAIQAEDSEVDPLTEADVFMAYGRYEAAEERLNEAIKQDPSRGELRVKLLELFTTTKNKKSFETAAEDYYASLNGQTNGNALWQKVVSMGADIAPNNPLFSGGGGGGMNFSNTSNLNNSKVMDIGLNTGTFSKSDFATPSAPAKNDNAMDFNLDFDDKTVIPPKKAAPTAAVENTENSLDFNLDFGNSSSSATSATEAETGGGLDFNLDLAKDEEPTATDIQFDVDDHTATLDFDLESPGPSSGASSSSNRSTMEMNLEASDSMTLDMPTGGDEVGTKLDLARAYIDMGDPDGARSILDEVIAEGNEGQKQEARQLMQQIG